MSAQAVHPTYNRTNFSTFICNHGNWDIYASATGHCAAIPSAAGEKVGCNATHFGDMAYTRSMLANEIAAEQAARRAAAGDDAVVYGLALAEEVPA